MTDRRVAYLDLDATLLGPGGSLLRGAHGPSDAAARALMLLHEAGVPVVLVSGRSFSRLDAIGQVIGAAGVLPELGSLDVDYPTRPGQTVFEAIAESGIVDELLAREPGLERHPFAPAREGGHVLRGRVGPEADAFVRARSGGRLTLADNGQAGQPGTWVYHLMPAGASKAAAVKRDIARRGADPAACLAVGDSPQDLGIAEVVGHMALVANGSAVPEAPEGVVVTEGAYGEGVLEAVQAWLAAAPAVRSEAA
jgi:hydroxymethylpyrimidine pyrophosphatase-like HAD family hydrolase